MRIVLAELVRWFYWYPFRLFIQRIPLNMSYAVADFLTPVFALASRGKRRRIHQGVSMMYRGNVSRARTREIARDTFNNILRSAIEVLWYPKLTEPMSRRLFTLEGVEHLDEALKLKRGVVLLHGHFGNAHLIMPAIGYRGYPLSQMGSRNPPEPVTGPFAGIINRIRRTSYEIKLRYKEALPVNFIYTDRSMRDAYRRLENNEIIAIALDGREGTHGTEFDFLGGKAIFYTGAMNLIQRTGPVVLPVFHVRNRDNTHRLVIEKPLPIDATADREADARNNIRKFLDLLEQYVYRYPGHYAHAFCARELFFTPPKED